MSFGLSHRFFGSISKHPGDADRNEDAFKWSPERSVLALSDGASESFDSRSWARILVRMLVLKPVLSMARLDLAIAAFTEETDRRPASVAAAPASIRPTGNCHPIM